RRGMRRYGRWSAGGWVAAPTADHATPSLWAAHLNSHRRRGFLRAEDRQVVFHNRDVALCEHVHRVVVPTRQSARQAEGSLAVGDSLRVDLRLIPGEAW